VTEPPQNFQKATDAAALRIIASVDAKRRRVARTLREKSDQQLVKKVPPQPQPSDADLLGAFGRLMERYPRALLGTARLPASKQKMKAVIKEVWRQEPKLRADLDIAYLYLSQFQDGIGVAVIDLHCMGLNPLNQETVEMVEHWLAWEKVSMAEMEILMQEWEKFEGNNGT
jgi:hypothetical protein